MLKTLLLMALLTAPPTLEERVANLETQIQALESIQVPADLRDEKEARIAALRVERHGADFADVSKGR